MTIHQGKPSRGLFFSPAPPIEVFLRGGLQDGRGFTSALGLKWLRLFKN